MSGRTVRDVTVTLFTAPAPGPASAATAEPGDVLAFVLVSAADVVQGLPRSSEPAVCDVLAEIISGHCEWPPKRGGVEATLFASAVAAVGISAGLGHAATTDTVDAWSSRVGPYPVEDVLRAAATWVAA